MNLQNLKNILTLVPEAFRQDIKDVLLSSLLFIAAYAPSPFGFLIYFAFIPQFNLFKRLPPLRSFVYGYLIGLLINAFTLFWLLFYAGLGFSLIVMGNAIQFALLGFILSALMRINERLALISFPFIWTFLEYSRQFGDLAFNWLNIAHTQSYFITIIQYVEYSGYLGIVLWICLLNVCFYYLYSCREQKKYVIRYGLIVFSLFLLPLIHGIIKLSEKPVSDGISASFIQPNILPEDKWDAKFKSQNMHILASMTDSILYTEPQIVVWPETAIPFMLKDSVADLLRIHKTIVRENFYLLTGTLDYLKYGEKIKRFNAVYFFTPAQAQFFVYRKLLLVPVEEAFPYRRHLPDWLGQDEKQQLTPGNEVEVFKCNLYPYNIAFNGDDWQIVKKAKTKKSYTIAAVICYEAVFPNLVRRFFEKDADLLIIVTNDSFFGLTAQPFQHQQAAVFRAIEQRTSVVRCANTGISTFIDPYGRQFFKSSLFTRSAAQKIIPVRLKKTFYSIYGDLLGIISGIFLISLLILLAINKIWSITGINPRIN
jgi:apolipoprotein N-acyltransferase